MGTGFTSHFFTSHFGSFNFSTLTFALFVALHVEVEDLSKEKLLQAGKSIYPKAGGVHESRGNLHGYIKIESGILKLFLRFEHPSCVAAHGLLMMNV